MTSPSGARSTGPTAIEGVIRAICSSRSRNTRSWLPSPSGARFTHSTSAATTSLRRSTSYTRARIGPSVAGTAIAQAEANPMKDASRRCLRSARATSCSTGSRILGWPPVLEHPKDRPGKISPSAVAKSFDQTVSPTSSRSSTWASKISGCPPMLISIWSPTILPTSPPDTASLHKCNQHGLDRQFHQLLVRKSESGLSKLSVL